MYFSTPRWSSTSSATTAQERQRVLTSWYMTLKKDAARVGLRYVGWLAWLASFHVPNSRTPSARKWGTSRRIWER